MEIFRFINWQWNRFDFEEKSLLIIIFVGFITVPVALLYGFNIWLAALLALLSMVSSAITIGIGIRVKIQWDKYKKYKDAEAQRIIDKLAGR